MISISDKIFQIIEKNMNPQQNHFPYIYDYLLALSMDKDECNLDKIVQQVLLALFQSSWNKVNTFLPMRRFSEDNKLFTAFAVRNIAATPKIELVFSIEAEFLEDSSIVIFDCNKIIANRISNGKSYEVSISDEEMEKYRAQFMTALKKAENQFNADFGEPVSMDFHVRKVNKAVFVKRQLEVENQIANALWDVLYANGLSRFSSFEIEHIKKLYSKATFCFPQYGKLPREKRFELFRKAYERSGTQKGKDGDGQSLYYEILKNNLDGELRTEARMLTKVAEKRGRTVPDEYVVVGSEPMAHPNVKNVVYVLYDGSKGYESFTVGELWSFLRVV